MYGEAVGDGDYSTLHFLLSDECQEQYGVGDLQTQIEFMLVFAAGFVGEDAVKNLLDSEVSEIVFDEFVEDETAVVRYTRLLDGELLIALDDEGDGALYVYEGGRWRQYGCDFEAGFGFGDE